jgi:hypothetical protein
MIKQHVGYFLRRCSVIRPTVCAGWLILMTAFAAAWGGDRLDHNDHKSETKCPVQC